MTSPVVENDLRTLAEVKMLLPGWVKEIFPHQIEAVEEIIDAYKSGARLVILDAPTGSGKTLIAELVRRIMNYRALYVCSTKALQDQFLHDFPYAALLKGRNNYPTQRKPFPDWTAEDCTKAEGIQECEWCWEVRECAYEIAKGQAIRADIAVLNSAYYLAEANYVGRLRRNLVILDEADLLEKELMGFATFTTSKRLVKKLRVEVPKKGVHKKTILEWITDVWIPKLKSYAEELEAQVQSGQPAIAHVRESKLVSNQYHSAIIIRKQLEDNPDAFIRENVEGQLVLKPVIVNHYGHEYLWRHSKFWLAMSATIISPDEFVESLGFDKDYRVVRVPMTFPAENRQVHVAPVADMSYKLREESWPKVVEATDQILLRHPKDRTLVHTVSYELTRYLKDNLQTDRPVFSYRSSYERDSALRNYRKQPGAILLAPSFDRGIDLKEDDCRVQVIVKIPYPNISDPQISARTHLDGGGLWYVVQAIRTLVQMSGRGVRTKDDKCETYILDKQFVKKIHGQYRSLLPSWWKEALNMGFPTKELIKGDR